MFNIDRKFASIVFIFNVIGWFIITAFNLSFGLLKDKKEDPIGPYVAHDGNSENIRAINYK